jgi:hypothetical protein
MDYRHEHVILTSFQQILEKNLLLEFIVTELKYYTTWNLIFVALYKYTSRYIDLHLSCLIVGFSAFCITYIHPREFVARLNDQYSIKFDCSPFEFYGCDFLIHWLPLVLVFWLVPIGPIGYKTCLTFLGILFFLMVVDAVSVYKTHIGLCFGFTVFAILVRYMLGPR